MSQVTLTKRTPASISRRAVRVLEPNSVRPVRLAAHHLGLARGAGEPPVEVGGALGVQRVVLLAQEAGVGAGPANRLPPAQVARQVDVVRQLDPPAGVQ